MPQPLEELVLAALDFFDTRLFEQYMDDIAFAVRVPGQEPMIATILGADDEGIGLGVHRGPRALTDWLEQWEAEPPPDLWAAADSLSMTESPLVETSPGVRALVARLRPGSDIGPSLIAKEPHRIPRDLRPDEVVAMTMIVRGVSRAHRERKLLPIDPFETPGRIFELELSGDRRAPDVETRVATYPVVEREPAAPVPAPDGLWQLPAGDEQWVVGLRVLPSTAEDDDRLVYGLIVIDVATGLVLTVKVLLGLDVGEAARALYDVCIEHGELPGLLVHEHLDLMDATGDALDDAGVVCSSCVRLPPIDDVIDAFDENLDVPFGAGAGDPSLHDFADLPVPAAHDVDAWMQVEHGLRTSMVQSIIQGRMLTRTASKRYFGDAVAAEELPHAELSAAEWLFGHYSPTKDAPTLAEQLLHAPLPEVVHRLLEARLRAAPSIYRVRDTGADSVTLVDSTDGTVQHVRDKSFFENVVPGTLVLGSVVSIGWARFFVPLAPAIGPDDAGAALAFLKRRRLSLAPGGLAARPHLAGRLWIWSLERLEDDPEAPRPRRAGRPRHGEDEQSTSS